MATRPIAIEPISEPGLEQAVVDGGGEVAGVTGAEGLIWIDPRDPKGLGERLGRSPAEWIQLPFAGIESFFEAGVIDPARTWTCAKGAYGHACAEHALALMLTAARRIHHHARDRRWEVPGFGSPERRLKDALVLVVGTGGIGSELVPMLQPLGARIVGVNRSGTPLRGAERTGTTDELPDLVGDVDFVVIAAALTPATRHLFDAELLQRMKPTTWLVNVARGGLVDTDALVDALSSGTIAGAALDVTEPEPLPEGHPLWDLDNVVITPHVANTWDMALPDLRALVRRNVENFVTGGELEGRVDPSLGY